MKRERIWDMMRKKVQKRKLSKDWKRFMKKVVIKGVKVIIDGANYGKERICTTAYADDI